MEKNLPPHKKVAAWFQTLWLCYVTEIQDRILMSWKRLIKFVGISLVPIIYGVVCMVAFWNPIDNIGRAPIAIMNLDHNIILVKQFDTNFAKDDQANPQATLSYKLGALTYQDPNNPTPGDMDNTLFPGGNSVDNLNDYIRTQMVEGKQYFLNNGQSFYFDREQTNLSVTSVWEIVKGMLLPKTDNSKKDEDYVFKTAKIDNKIALTNIHYISNEEEINHQWKNSKYYVQARIPDSFSADFFGWLGSVINKWPNQDETHDNDRPEDWKNILKPLELWTTFERNFIFGYYMQTFATFASGLVYQAIPNLFANFLTGQLLENILISGEDLMELNDPNTEPNFPGFNKNDNFFLLRTGDDIQWINNIDNVTPNSLFGKINWDGTYVSGQVGGKLLRSFQNIQDLKTSGVIEIIRRVLPGVSSDLIELIVNSISNLLNKVQDNERVNATFYKLVTGQWVYDSSSILDREIMKFLTDLGFDTANPDHLKEQVTIFPIDGQFVSDGVGSEAELNNSVDDFMIRNPNTFRGIIGLRQWPAAIAARLIANLTGDISAQDLMHWSIQGQENGVYGIGLGQFFLVIGLWVGVLMQTFVFDRAKRVKKATASQWYLSKTMLMGTVVLVQATLEIWVAYAFGFHQIGASAMCFLWLWFMASGLMFVFIIQGIWFSCKDETIGKFFAVVFMVLSLAAGGGTFPAFSQFKFFYAISFIVPFTYVLRGTGAIIYGVAINGTTASTTNVIMSNWWPFFIFIAIFLVIGLVIGAPQRFKEMNWGSHRGYKVSNALIALGQDPDAMGFRNVRLEKVNGKIIYHYNWDALKPGFDLPLYLKCRQMYPFEGRFKWWERKHHDPVQRPNWSDEDIMTRNE